MFLRLISVLSIINFGLTYGNTLDLPFKNKSFKKPSLTKMKQRMSQAMCFSLKVLAKDVGIDAASLQFFNTLIESAQSDQVNGKELSLKIFDSAVMTFKECKNTGVASFVSAFFLTPVLLRARTEDVVKISELLCKDFDSKRRNVFEGLFADFYFARFKVVNNCSMTGRIWRQRLPKRLSKAKIVLKGRSLESYSENRFKFYSAKCLLDLDWSLRAQVDNLIDKIFESAEISAYKPKTIY